MNVLFLVVVCHAPVLHLRKCVGKMEQRLEKGCSSKSRRQNREEPDPV